MKLILPDHYSNLLTDIEHTEKAIKYVKDMFQDNLSAQLALLRVTAPMTVLKGQGLNDDLNGVEHPVSVCIFYAKRTSERSKAVSGRKRCVPSVSSITSTSSDGIEETTLRVYYLHPPPNEW